MLDQVKTTTENIPPILENQDKGWKIPEKLGLRAAFVLPITFLALLAWSVLP